MIATQRINLNQTKTYAPEINRMRILYYWITGKPVKECDIIAVLGEVTEWFMVPLSKFASGYPKMSFYIRDCCRSTPASSRKSDA